MADIMSDYELLALPVSVPVVVAARAFGLGRNKASELARAGEFPCPVIRVGERYRVNRAVLYGALDFDPVAAANRLVEETANGLHQDMPKTALSPSAQLS